MMMTALVVEDDSLKRGRRKEKGDERLKGKKLGLGRELVRDYFFVGIAFAEVTIFLFKLWENYFE